MRSMESILVASDLTERSDDVLRAAAALAALTDAKLHVIHAFEFQALPYSEGRVAGGGFEGRVQEAQRELDEQIRRAVRPGVEVASREVVIYVAHRAILERAEAVDADLIVLGPHRGKAVGAGVLGSTADRVVRTAGVPCLVVREPLSLPLRRVVTPLDLSEPALGALEVALRWSGALRPGDGEEPPRVTVLHVIPSVFGGASFPFEEQICARLHDEVEAAMARIPEAAGLEVREEVRWDDAPAQAIVQALAEDRSDLVVLATHGYGALKRALIGSVASAVAQSAGCPVLLVPPSLWDAG